MSADPTSTALAQLYVDEDKTHKSLVPDDVVIRDYLSCINDDTWVRHAELVNMSDLKETESEEVVKEEVLRAYIEERRRSNTERRDLVMEGIQWQERFMEEYKRDQRTRDMSEAASYKQGLISSFRTKRGTEGAKGTGADEVKAIGYTGVSGSRSAAPPAGATCDITPSIYSTKPIQEALKSPEKEEDPYPVEQPAEQAPEPADKPEEETEQPAEEASQPAEVPAEEPQQTEELAEETSYPVEQPAEEVSQPVEEPAEQPAEEVSQPVEEPAEQPAEEVSQPVEEPAEQPVEEATEQPVEEPAEEASQPAEVPAEEPQQTEELAEETSYPVEQPAEEATEQPVEEPQEEVAQDAPEEAAGDAPAEENAEAQE
ncbi:hypothetical protein, conserved [Trypanosoma brucei gambiense DAL972]|uniref:Uncharacterized protein n=1 Tax=Trypanosoma brucei gambiense (strain MHOM/CI/86/DAL972) TaxID=679716 RepID=D0AA48_TRYB9|nr:hypothetical protein, conserved [Trypanosoma brucei gambiense DAL972]CBH18549.1 hypothetical protein, conserved [Trypanosoma brucei gambiense DAL972]|eukprot:XP_011780813.1 hypothetical protein, conserved [Trypanosoma brucei gambiense DAL972]